MRELNYLECDGGPCGDPLFQEFIGRRKDLIIDVVELIVARRLKLYAGAH